MHLLSFQYLEQVGTQTSIKTTEFSLPFSTNISVPSQDKVSLISGTWVTVKEPIGAWGEDNFTVRGILEHLNVTKDRSDYLWYMTRYSLSKSYSLKQYYTVEIEQSFLIL